MKNLEREPVWKLKEYIWRSFLISTKKHFFLTGKRQTGKTSIFKALLEQITNYQGIVTYAVRDTQGIPTYVILQDIKDSSISAVIGKRNRQNNNLYPCLEGFDKTGVQLLNNFLSTASEWVVIDEIGFLENESQAFKNVIRKCLQEKKVIAVLRKDSTPFLEELYSRQDALLVDLDSM